MSAACPCCGQPVEESRLLVDLDMNNVSRFGITLHLPPQLAEVIYVLNEKYPKGVRVAEIIGQIYGARDEPEFAARAVFVRVSQLRRSLAQLGVRIDYAPKGAYRLHFESEAIGIRRPESFVGYLVGGGAR
jgi:hypothetical protein